MASTKQFTRGEWRTATARGGGWNIYYRRDKRWLRSAWVAFPRQIASIGYMHSTGLLHPDLVYLSQQATAYARRDATSSTSTATKEQQ